LSAVEKDLTECRDSLLTSVTQYYEGAGENEAEDAKWVKKIDAMLEENEAHLQAVTGEMEGN
jgi:hypothetical protein